MKKTFIAIEGPIGVGKSSLTKKLAEALHYTEEFEIVDENPYLSDFYDDISKWSFQTEMFFLCHRYKQLTDLENINGIVSDYHIFKNKIFAKNTLNETEFDKFSRIYDILTEDIRMPDQIIFLDASFEVLQQRIAHRNRSYETQIENDYLAQLKRDYNQFYEEVKNEIDAIQIDTSQLDFVNNTADYQQVLNLLQPLIGEIIHDK
ncbi:deoxynucleoside kinase [Mammaliicoccus sciuri]|uniref:deoxynucleoside kinase n=1 Tax=Mammaliicoccus sciuri TaxID=1296 RepID=UPI0021D273EA|nr:deoxynucleoside kinase [Mammaliicoccus sciuri]UXU83704.1 deoxynucleoside kinase [Mammaliicoccus sciuri]UXU93551.1 deoxynucleoside kinase [Mammaliicoccus sciuri]UXV15499.1 deoxynucleoside kinase [Mammaliicoccus sciuri]UXV23762.1 deoxynucleoside kinase [Mammaliicoccus sciuri]UXV26542.1 deoxynucleoside kinase [Mammaliicoccus sciuri]